MAKPARIVTYVAIFLIAFYAIISIAYSLFDDMDGKYPNMFVRENIHVDAEQTVGKLIVAHSNAIVSGKIADSIVVVDGNLTLKPGAAVHGKIFVLGGKITIEPCAIVKKMPIVVTTPGYLVAPVIIGALFLLGTASLVVVPVLLWVIGHLFKKTQWYSRLIKLFQSVQRRWPAFYILTSFAISALMLTAFSTLAWKTMFRRSVDLFDDAFIWIVRYFASVALDQVMIIISLLGSGLSYIIILVAAIFLLGRYRRWLEIGALTICLSGGAALNLLLKHLFQRARPDMFRMVQESGYSFPSGHAMASVYFFGMAAFLIMRTVPTWRWRLVVATLAVFLIIAIGISRIYLGVHYPSDVVAGYAAGSMWLAFCISFLMWWEQQRRTMEK